VLYVCGHAAKGRDGNKTAFQQHGMWFATHGYVCLIIDTLQLGEIAGIHHGTYNRDRWWWQARGYTPAGVECWNGIRAIDYLQSRPEVDGEKIAVTGISGGGAVTFWITAADERVKVCVPVSGMSDLGDYVGKKIVNGHCDCMFLINTHQWPWTSIAGLIAPRPMLFENSGHDPIFPMPSNDRIRARLEQLYGLYTNKTADIFDIGVTPGGHADNPELRLMAYRWINKQFKGDNKPVTEPVLRPEEGQNLRAFPNELPADEINSKIDESFVALHDGKLPNTPAEFSTWRDKQVSELRRVSFAGHRSPVVAVIEPQTEFTHEQPTRGSWLTEERSVDDPSNLPNRSADVVCQWHYLPPKGDSNVVWMIVLNPRESLDKLPEWAASVVGKDAAVLLSPRGSGSLSFEDKPPFYIARSSALIGRTIDSGRVADVLAFTEFTHFVASTRQWKLAGSGQAGVIGAYAAALAPTHMVSELVLVNPPTSHRDGPIFLNVLRVTDIPQTLGLLAPRKVSVVTENAKAFAPTQSVYQVMKGSLAVGK
jgi:dienelactone hydrolase